MADSKTTHTIEIKASAKAVVDAGKEVKKALDPRSADKLGASLKMLVREVKAFRAETAASGKATAAAATAGIREFKGLAAAIKEATEAKKAGRREDAARRAEEQQDRNTRQADRARERAEAAQRRAEAKAEAEERRRAGEEERRAKLSRRRSFWGGLAQGVGLAEFMPAEEGMRQRMVGAAVGKGVRAAASPFTSPGMGGLQRALGALPVAGDLAAGALQSASSFYSAATGFDRARLGNVHWAGGLDVFSRGRAPRVWVPGEDPAAPAPAVGRILTTDPPHYGPAEGRTQSRKSAAPSPAKARAPSPATGPVSAEELRRRVREMGRQHDKSRARALDPEVWSAPGGEGERWSTATVGEGGAAEPKGHWSRDTGGLGDFGRFGPGFGASLGLEGSQVQQMLGSYMGARGGGAERGTAREAKVALAAHVGLGISPEAAGQFARMGREGGGGRNMGGGLAGILRAAVEQGLRGANVSEYLGALVEQGSEAEQRGVKIDVQGSAANTAMLGMLGVSSTQTASRVAAVNRGAMDVSEKGVSSPAHMMMLRAAGFDPRGGRSSYIRAIERLEGGLDPEAMSSMVFNLGREISSMPGTGSAEDQLTDRAFFMRRALGSVGMKVNAGTARDILGYGEDGWGEDDRQLLLDYANSSSGGGAKSRRKNEKWLVGGAEDLAGKGAPLAVTAASIQAEQIALGQQWSGTMAKLERIGNANVAMLGNFHGAIGKVVDMMKTFQGGLNSWIKDIMVPDVGPPKKPKRPERPTTGTKK